jgi:4-hydroxy-2-oxoheptanedioate aldolase
VLGTFLKLAAMEVVDILAGAGFDFVIVDLEHSQLSVGQPLRLVQYARALGLPAVVRLPACDAGLVNRLLEAGAEGIQLSSVRRVDEVRELVQATQYPPGGHRSVSLAHPMAGYGSMSLSEAIAGPRPLLIGQVESAETDDLLEDILAVGLDVAFIGTTDLLVNVRLDVDRQRRRVAEIERAIEVSGVIYGTFAADTGAIPNTARYVALSSDLAMLGATARRMVADGG